MAAKPEDLSTFIRLGLAIFLIAICGCASSKIGPDQVDLPGSTQNELAEKLLWNLGAEVLETVEPALDAAAEMDSETADEQDNQDQFETEAIDQYTDWEFDTSLLGDFDIAKFEQELPKLEFIFERRYFSGFRQLTLQEANETALVGNLALQIERVNPNKD